jgi:hypothetical protein
MATCGLAEPWHLLSQVLDLLPATVAVDNGVFYVHGALAPAIIWVAQLFAIDQNREIDAEKAADLT